MRIAVHDYCGHPFQIQLSRALAARGHDVLHLFSGSISSPRGAVDRQPDDPETFAVREILLDDDVAKYDYARRAWQELQYAGRLVGVLRGFKPDVVLASNTPIDVLSAIDQYAHLARIPWLLWLQDIQSVAIEKYAAHKLPVGGKAVARFYTWREKRLFDHCSRIVAISDGFIPVIERIGGDGSKVTVIENWAPLDAMPVRPRANAWGEAKGLQGGFTFLYSGTMGLKHDPELVAALAEHFADRDEVRVVVASQGPGADYLSEQKQSRALDNLVLLPWQPFDELPDVLGSADVLLAILEPDAGVLSVPSKVLTNLCSGRPQLLSVPPENLAAQIVQREQAGLCVPPADTKAWLDAAEVLVDDAELRQSSGERGRAYAERAFDIDAIAGRFEDLIRRAEARPL